LRLRKVYKRFNDSIIGRAGEDGILGRIMEPASVNKDILAIFMVRYSCGNIVARVVSADTKV
jgi:hypothetical protein